MSDTIHLHYTEKELNTIDGGLVLLLFLLVSIFCFLIDVNTLVWLALISVFVVSSLGFMVIKPNQALLALFFGRYVGTKKRSGFYWTNHLFRRKRISTKIQNLTTEMTSFEDKHYNKINMNLSVNWRVENTAQAVFLMENYGVFLQNHTLNIIKKSAKYFTYQDKIINIHENMTEIEKMIKKELIEKVEFSGLIIEDVQLIEILYSEETRNKILEKRNIEEVLKVQKKIANNILDLIEETILELEERELVVLDNSERIKLINQLIISMDRKNIENDLMFEKVLENVETDK